MVMKSEPRKTPMMPSTRNKHLKEKQHPSKFMIVNWPALILGNRRRTSSTHIGKIHCASAKDILTGEKLQAVRVWGFLSLYEHVSHWKNQSKSGIGRNCMLEHSPDRVEVTGRALMIGTWDLWDLASVLKALWGLSLHDDLEGGHGKIKTAWSAECRKWIDMLW